MTLTTSLYTYEWTVELWFKYYNNEVYLTKATDTINLAGHDTTSCTSNTRFTLSLPQSSTSVFSRTPTVYATDGTNSQTFTDITNILADRTWYHFSMVGDWKNS